MDKRFAIVTGVAAAGVMALGAQTATSTTGPVDSVPPDIRLWGNETDQCCLTNDKQKLGGAVKVKVGCGDEACTVRAEGKVYWRSEEAAARMSRPDPPGRSHEVHWIKHGRLKAASADVGPGETTRLRLKLTEKRRKKARNALDNGLVAAEVTVYATDAAGNEANTQGYIRLLEHHPRG